MFGITECAKFELKFVNLIVVSLLVSPRQKTRVRGILEGERPRDLQGRVV